MDCATFENIVHEMNRPGTQGALQSEDAFAHAELCSHCAALLTQVEWLEFSLSSAVQQSATIQAPPRVEAWLLQEFRSRNAARAQKQLRGRLAAIGVAAAVLLALALTLHHRISSPETQPSAAASHFTTPAPQTVSTPAPNIRPADTVPAASPSAHAQSKTAVSSQATDVEDAASFTPLPYADDSSAFDGGAIVRVEMARASLASFGVPAADSGSNERIPVDLVLSADGTPEAFRLVSQGNTSAEF